MYVYMEVTMDKYELPVAVADSVKELANIRKTSAATIWTVMNHAKNRNWRCKYVKVEVEDD